MEIGFDNTHSAKLNQLTCMISVADEEEKNKTIFARTSHSEPEKLEHLRDSLKHAIMTNRNATVTDHYQILLFQFQNTFPLVNM